MKKMKYTCENCNRSFTVKKDEFKSLRNAVDLLNANLKLASCETILIVSILDEFSKCCDDRDYRSKIVD